MKKLVPSILFQLLGCMMLWTCANKSQPSTPAKQLFKNPSEQVEQNENVKIYLMEESGCQIRWQEHKGINQGVVHFDYACDQGSSKQRLNLLDRVLARAEKENPQPAHTLFLGRILNDNGLQKHQLSQRLALAALNSKIWDPIKGQATNGNNHKLVASLSTQFNIYPEYQALFAKHGYLLAISSVEKVLVDKIENLPFALPLKSRNIDPKLKVPYDALIWFKLNKIKS